MGKAKSYEGLTVRVPINMARELKKLKEEKDLPSMGSALQIYIENMKIERIENRIATLEKRVKPVILLFEKQLQRVGMEIGRKIFKEEQIFERFFSSLDPEERQEAIEDFQRNTPNWKTKWAPKLAKFADPIYLEGLKKRDKEVKEGHKT